MWHQADVTKARRDVRFQGESGHEADWLSLPSLTQRGSRACWLICRARNAAHANRWPAAVHHSSWPGDSDIRESNHGRGNESLHSSWRKPRNYRSRRSLTQQSRPVNAEAYGDRLQCRRVGKTPRNGWARNVYTWNLVDVRRARGALSFMQHLLAGIKWRRSTVPPTPWCSVPVCLESR